MERAPADRIVLSTTREADVNRARILVRDAARGRALRLRPGAYARRDDWDGGTELARHLARADAVDVAARSEVVFSHRTAAALWGIPLLGGLDGPVHVRAGAASGRRTRDGVVRVTGSFPADHIRGVAGLLATSPALTALDLAAAGSVLDGLVAVEHVLHPANGHDVALETLRALHDPRRPYRNCRRVDEVLDFASARSASVLETLSRWQIRRYGFEQPQQQREYRGVTGAEYAVDFWWPSVDVIGEADGWGKYEQRAAERGVSVEHVLRDEKRREDELRAQSRGFVRWEWADAWAGEPLAAKLRRAGVPRAR